VPGNDQGESSQRILAVTITGSAALCVGLALAYWWSGSELALAHAADSGLDVVTALVLAWTVRIASQPRDADHPFGHSRAEPIGALFVAFIAGALALEVGRDAVVALIDGHTVRPSWALSVFAVKAIFKLWILLWARRHSGPAMQALVVDARNDVLTCVLAGIGIWGAAAGWPDLDAWLALPLSAWIGWTGVDLARDNIRRLMGESPSEAKLAEIEAVGLRVDGVSAIHDTRAHYLGTRLQVHLHVVVDESLTVRAAHDIGDEVRIRIEALEDVAHCSVHIDVEEDPT
jgi:cation diffusion facilitator family transporter